MRINVPIFILVTLSVITLVSTAPGFSFRSKQAQNKKVIWINKSNDKPLSPVIFVPGDGGSQVEAKLNKTSQIHYSCAKKADWFNIWLNLELLIPWEIDCWIDNFRLYYNNETRTTSNTPGVEIRIPGWGDPEVVEWLDPTHNRYGTYFKDIANALVSVGYVRNVSIRGAPYDFRKAPNENKEWFSKIKTLVEETYELNHQIPITFIVHSMGGPMTLTFLQQQPDAWKTKYIARIISLAAAWAGSVKAVKVYAIGDDLGALALSASVMRPEEISSPSLAWILPHPLFWKPDEVLVQTQNRTYKMDDMEDFFNDLQFTDGWNMRKDVMKYTDFTPPGVEVHCLFGSQIQTVEKLEYRKSLTLDGTPTLVYGDGDGTVNERSLNACSHWINMKEQKNKNITLVEYPKVEHLAILSDTKVIQYVLDLLVG